MSNLPNDRVEQISIENKWDRPSGSVLPMQLVDEKDEIIEELICDSISGGQDEVAGMPRKLTLMKLSKGNLIGRAEYHFIKLLPSEAEEGEKTP